MSAHCHFNVQFIITTIVIALGISGSGCSSGSNPPGTPADDAQSVIANDAQSAIANDDPGVSVVTNDGPEGNSGLTVNDRRYPLNAAFADIWGVSGDHFQVDITLTNGDFEIQSVNIDGHESQLFVPTSATAIVHASLFSPGGSFSFANYSVVLAENEGMTLLGVGYFKDAYVGLDANNDGIVSQAEQRDVIDGTFEVAVAPPSFDLRFQLTLIDGQSVSGEYTGLIDLLPRILAAQ